MAWFFFSVEEEEEVGPIVRVVAGVWGVYSNDRIINDFLSLSLSLSLGDIQRLLVEIYGARGPRPLPVLLLLLLLLLLLWTFVRPIFCFDFDFFWYSGPSRSPPRFL